MITAKTLISLACLMANKGELNTSSVEAQLTEPEKAQIEQIINSGACFSEQFEKYLQKSKDIMGDDGGTVSAPCYGS